MTITAIICGTVLCLASMVIAYLIRKDNKLDRSVTQAINLAVEEQLGNLKDDVSNLKAMIQFGERR